VILFANVSVKVTLVFSVVGGVVVLCVVAISVVVDEGAGVEDVYSVLVF